MLIRATVVPEYTFRDDQRYVTFTFTCCGNDYVVPIEQTIDAIIDLAAVAHSAEHPECVDANH